jgi:hypothetical protein
MIDNLDNYLVGIAIGIRFRANFSIEDQLGSIVDQILYSKSAYFNEQVFKFTENHVNQKVLINNETGDKLTINNSNIILEINFSNKFGLSDLDTLVKKFDSEIIENVLKKYKITQFVRVGYIKRYLFDLETLAKSFIQNTIGSTFDGVNDIDLRFSKKFPVPDSLVKKEIYDYDNVIFNIIKRSDRNEIFMSLDYQKHFIPHLESTGGIEFQKFVDKVNRFSGKTYLNWLNKNYLNA